MEKQQVFLSQGCMDTCYRGAPRAVLEQPWLQLGRRYWLQGLFGGAPGHPQGTEHSGTRADSAQKPLSIKSALLLKNKLEKTKLSERLLLN